MGKLSRNGKPRAVKGIRKPRRPDWIDSFKFSGFHLLPSPLLLCIITGVKNMPLKLKIFLSVLSFLMLFPVFYGFSEGTAEQDFKVYTIPVSGEIERGLAYFVRRAVREAEDAGADAIIVVMDTPGGDFASTEAIMRVLLNSSVETLTYVKGYAFSAGAFIAVSTQSIYMAPATVIGAATPVAAGPGGPAEMGEAVEQKITSGIRAIMRAAAEENEHPLELVEAMVDRDVEIEGIIEKGKLLTLTNRQAEEAGLSAGTFESLEDLLKEIFGESVDIVDTEISWAEKLARMLTGSGVRSLLLMLGLLGLYMEARTPGIGLAGAVSGICFVLFFFGHYAAGLAGWEELIIFMLGLTFLGLEIFIIPGFGVAGILGILLILTSLVMAMTGLPGAPGIPWWSGAQFEQAFRTMGAAIAGSIAAAVLFFRFVLPKTPMWDIISLNASEQKDQGFQMPSRLEYLGKTGTAKTMLRPAGKAEVDGEVLNVVAEGELIQKGENIRVISVEGNRMVVAREGRAE